MTTVLWILLGLGWFTSGFAGFVFHWTYDYDFRGGDVVMACCAGVALGGPLSWILGYFIHPRQKNYSPPRTLIRQRGR